MPRISEFFGIVIAMYFGDHAPPHFHAEYGGEEVLIRIDTLEIYRGAIHRRAQALVLEWASLHRAELWDNWERASRRAPVVGIPPLD